MHARPTLVPFQSLVVNPKRETGLTLVLTVVCQDFISFIGTFFLQYHRRCA